MKTRKRWGIEFRNGGWLQSLDPDVSGPSSTAATFATKAEAERVFANGAYMFEGPMAKRLPSVASVKDTKRAVKQTKTPEEVEYEVQFVVKIRVPGWMDQANQGSKNDRKTLEASIISSGRHAVYDEKTVRVMSVKRLKEIPKPPRTYARIRFSRKLHAFLVSTTKSVPRSTKRRWSLWDLDFKTVGDAVKWIRGAGFVLDYSA